MDTWALPSCALEQTFLACLLIWVTLNGLNKKSALVFLGSSSFRSFTLAKGSFRKLPWVIVSSLSFPSLQGVLPRVLAQKGPSTNRQSSFIKPKSFHEPFRRSLRLLPHTWRGACVQELRPPTTFKLWANKPTLTWTLGCYICETVIWCKLEPA